MATRKFTRKELVERNNKTDVVFIIENNVYDVTKFLDDHPGGHEVLFNVAGQDGTEDFDDVGHSLDAKALMKNYFIGELVDEDKTNYDKQNVNWNAADTRADSGGFLTSWKFPVVLGLIMTVLYTYLFG